MATLVEDINEGRKFLASEKNQKPPKPWSTSWDAAVETKYNVLSTAAPAEEQEEDPEDEEEAGAEVAA